MNPNRKKMLTAGAVLLSIACLGFLVVRNAIVRAADADPTELIPEKDYRESRPPKTPAQSALPAPGTDLLDLVQTPQDAIAGAWGFQDRALLTAGQSWGRLQVPCVPPQEYDLAFRLTRKRGVGSFNIGFVQEGRQGMVVLDGDEGHSSWISLSSEADPDNETLTVGKVLKWNRECRITVSVRKDRVGVSVDGKPLIDWKGNASRLSFPAGWNVPNPKALFLASWDSVFRIDEAVLTPVTGTASVLR